MFAKKDVESAKLFGGITKITDEFAIAFISIAKQLAEIARPGTEFTRRMIISAKQPHVFSLIIFTRIRLPSLIVLYFSLLSMETTIHFCSGHGMTRNLFFSKISSVFYCLC